MKLKLIQPDLEEVRDGARLMIWGTLAQWLIVDQELHSLLQLFRSPAQPHLAAQLHAERWNRKPEEVVRDLAGLLPGLLQAGIIRQEGRSLPPVVPPQEAGFANLTVNLTNRCNLRCSFCYNLDRGEPEIPVQDLLGFIARFRTSFSPNASLIILGGEPTLDRVRLMDLIRGARPWFTQPILVSTNGTLMDRELAGFLAESGVEVQVSIDGSHAGNHDPQRGPGVFARAVEAVSILKQAGARTIISMVYNRTNFQDMEAYLDLGLTLGADEVRFIPLRMIGRGLAFQENAPDQLEVFRHLNQVLTRRPELLSLLSRDYFTILATISRHSQARKGCGLGDKVLFVDADGAIYPCPNHVGPLHQLGRVTSFAGEDLMTALPGLAAYAALTTDHLEQCSSCPVRPWCGGDCRGEARAVVGRASAPSPHCGELRRLIPELMWTMSLGTCSLGSAPLLVDGRAPGEQFLS